MKHTKKLFTLLLARLHGGGSAGLRLRGQRGYPRGEPHHQPPFGRDRG